MGTITLKIQDDLENKLRKKVGEVRGAERGAISQSVEEAIRLWLASTEQRRSSLEESRYVALDGSRSVAEASTLELLARELRKAGISPRSVIIESIPRASLKRRMGLRTTNKIVNE